MAKMKSKGSITSYILGILMLIVALVIGAYVGWVNFTQQQITDTVIWTLFIGGSVGIVGWLMTVPTTIRMIMKKPSMNNVMGQIIASVSMLFLPVLLILLGVLMGGAVALASMVAGWTLIIVLAIMVVSLIINMVGAFSENILK